MPSTISILSRLKNDFPNLNFVSSDSFSWCASEKTIYYDQKNTADSNIFLLHELSHAVLQHANYKRDIELLQMERQAWDQTLILAQKYEISINDNFIQSNLDSYRDWLHSRSTCPKCETTGFQIDKLLYSCPTCQHHWRVNEAKNCSLRRYKIKDNKKRT